MEEKNPIRTSLVSRLPKYGTKPAGSSLQTLPNGTTLNLSGNTQTIDKNFSKHNGTLRMSSLSFNWRKSSKCQLGDQISGESSSSHNSNERLTGSEKCSQSQGAVGKEVLRIGSSSASSQTGKQSNMFVSSTEELSQKSLCRPPHSTKFTKSSLLGRTSYSGLNAPKSHLNGICGTQSNVGLQRNRGNSTATRSSSGENISKSIDNVQSSCEKMVRSQSFSHSIQNTLFPPASLTRSHSFNRAVDLSRPYQNQHLAIRTSQWSNLLSRNARQLEIPNVNESLKYGFPRSYTTSASSGLKKPPLSNGSGDAPSLRFRPSRTSLLKPSCQHLGRKIPINVRTNNDSEKCLLENSLISVNIHGGTDAKCTQDGERAEVTEVYNLAEDSGKVICIDGDVDEISISSLSSSEKNDLSEDFSDDFVDLEYRNKTIDIQEEEVSVQEMKCGNERPLDQLLSLKENEGSNCNSDEWLDIRVSVDEKSESAKHPSGNNVVSSDIDYRAGSSFELSPSDSSDGTYMWDEEGLEPIGSVHPCGSYDSSEMNSIDILNNLDSCDLEDDDLMLDVDLPEDVPCDNVDCENMNRYERPDRSIRQQKEGLWKRAPQRWNTQEHYHLSHTDHYHHSRTDLNRTSNYLDSPPVGHLEGCGAPCLYSPFGSLPPNTVMLDEMTLRHMVQDCTTVKAQLLKMKRILNQNDENVSLNNITLSLPPSPDLQEPEPIYKTGDLLSEITQLKEDLKKKDEIIRRLEHRLSIRCNCNRDSQKAEVTGCMYADKYTQTSLRKNSPQVLQPSSLLPRFTDLAQGRLIKTSPIVAHSEHPSQHQLRKYGHEYQNAATGSVTCSLNEPSTLNMQLKKPEENAHSVKNIKTREETGELTGRKIRMPQPHLSSSQSSTQVNTQEVETKLVPKKHCLQTNQASPPKTSKLAEPPDQNDLVPPSAIVAAVLQEDCSAPKEPGLLLPSSPTHSQSAFSQTHLNTKSQRTSKLRPPTVSFRPKQMTNPKIPIPPDPQNTRSKANRLKQPTQAKENMQSQSSNIHSGDGVTSNRHSRLPKPKTY